MTDGLGPGGASRATEVAGRVASLRDLLKRRAVDAALLGRRRNVSWLTAGARGHVLQSSDDAVVRILVTRNDIVAITQNIEAHRIATEELAGLDIEVASVPWWEPGAIEREARRRSGADRPADDDALEPDLLAVRSVLSPSDRAHMAHLGRTATAAVDSALASVEPGRTEEDLAADVIGRLPGVAAPVVLVAADERVALHRHPLPGRTAIRRRVMLVIVAEAAGLHVALTRMRELEPVSPELERRFAAVAAVRDAMHAATKPGATFGMVLAAGRQAYAAAGFPEEWREHHQGGSIGYQARERLAFPGDPTEIRAGMAFAWNPSIAGVKVEDTIVVDDHGSVGPVTV